MRLGERGRVGEGGCERVDVRGWMGWEGGMRGWVRECGMGGGVMGSWAFNAPGLTRVGGWMRGWMG